MLRNVCPHDVPLRSYARRQFENRGAAATPDIKDMLSCMRSSDPKHGLGHSAELPIDRFVLVSPGAGRRAVPELRRRYVARRFAYLP